LTGNCVTLLAAESPGSAHVCVTSPPYWNKMDYGRGKDADAVSYDVEWGDGWVGQLGLEPRVDQYVSHLVEVFTAVRRVLRDDGTLWLNIGPSMSGARYVDVPALAATALEEHGWVCRSRMTLIKKSPIPVADVCGTVWVRHQVKTGTSQRAKEGTNHATRYLAPQGERAGNVFVSGAPREDCPGCPACAPNGGFVLERERWAPTPASEALLLFRKDSSRHYYTDALAARVLDGRTVLANGSESGRNVFDYMDWQGGGSKEKHPAAFPEFLPEFCIKVGTPEAGVCATCSAPWARCVRPEPWTAERSRVKRFLSGLVETPKVPGQEHEVGRLGGQRQFMTAPPYWMKTCSCPSDATAGAVALDPFGGSGTTAVVATRMGRRSLLMDIDPQYGAVSTRRNSQLSLFEEASA
jgi:DNA modification methylase